jgi:hypothetical protein
MMAGWVQRLRMTLSAQVAAHARVRYDRDILVR